MTRSKEAETADAAGVLWALVQISEQYDFLGIIPSRHESVLEMDPTGRAMRPRP